jgi:hypothetical protein
MWIGLMLGTTLAVLAMVNGARLKVGDVPSFIGVFLGGVIVWLLVVGATTLVAELLRRHHKAIGRAAGHQAGRAATGGFRLARRHGGRGLNAAGRWADRRWHGRQTAPADPGREPVDLGTALRPSRWLPGRKPGDPFVDPNPTPVDSIPAVPSAPQPAAADGTGTDVPPGPPPAADGGGWGVPDPAADLGTGPWMLAVRRKDGQPYYGGPGGSQFGTAVVTDREDLRRRLAAAATDPDAEVRVAPVKDTGPEFAPGLSPAVEADVKRQVCEWGRAATRDGIEPAEVIVGADGTITVDRSRHSSGAYPQARPITVGLRWTPREGGGALVVDTAPAAARTTSPADGTVPAAANENQNHGGTGMTTATTNYNQQGYGPQAAGGLPRRTARTAAAPEPNGVWKNVISSTHGFEPENDSHLLGWMAGEAGGMSGYAEEIADVYETAVNTIGLDPVAMAALHDYADAAATAAEAMAKARQRFADHYSEVRQFTANGGVLPYNGRWMTGEGD